MGNDTPRCPAINDIISNIDSGKYIEAESLIQSCRGSIDTINRIRILSYLVHTSGMYSQGVPIDSRSIPLARRIAIRYLALDDIVEYVLCSDDIIVLSFIIDTDIYPRHIVVDTIHRVSNDKVQALLSRI